MVAVRRTLVGFVVVGCVVFVPSVVAIVPPPIVPATIHTVCASGCDFTTIQAAIDDSSTVTGDELRVSPGTYPEQVTVSKQLTIAGQPGMPAPVITSNGDTVTIAAGGAGSTLQHLDVRAGRAGFAALEADVGVTASDLALTSSTLCADLAGTTQFGPGITATETSPNTVCINANGPDVVLRGLTVNALAEPVMGMAVAGGAVVTDSTVNASFAASIANGGTARRDTFNGAMVGVETDQSGPNVISDSVATATAADGAAVRAFANPPAGTVATTILRNVTAIASGPASTGLDAQSSFTTSGGTLHGSTLIDAENVVARGTANDVAADPALNPCPTGATCLPGAVTISYSNLVTASPLVRTPVNAHIQSQDPLFINPTVGPSQDFHLAYADSPLIGAGTLDASNGPTDRDGITHPTPPSIGAYEPRPGLPTKSTGPSGGAPATGTPGSGGTPGSSGIPGGPGAPAGPSTIVATVSHEKLSPASFAAARTGSSATAAKTPHTGTIVSYTLDEPASVRFTVAAREPGRKTSRGHCTTPTKANRHAVACTGLVPLTGSFTRAGLAGTKRFRFTGRLSGHPIKPGAYQLVATPTHNGKTGNAATAAFHIEP
jgi:hypothetical protein